MRNDKILSKLVESTGILVLDEGMKVFITWSGDTSKAIATRSELSSNRCPIG